MALSFVGSLQASTSSPSIRVTPFSSILVSSGQETIVGYPAVETRMDPCGRDRTRFLVHILLVSFNVGTQGRTSSLAPLLRNRWPLDVVAGHVGRHWPPYPHAGVFWIMFHL